MRFVDTNILLYAVSTVPEQAAKADVARRLLEAEDLALSVQVLQEFYVQATRPTRAHPLGHDQAASLVEAFLRYPVQDSTVSLMKAAIGACRHYRISYWDAAILEAARNLGCRLLLSEDLTHHRDYGGVVVEDPFQA